MPQLWTETFVSQYFWLMLILLTFYYFMNIKVIPNIANALKLRQVSDSSEKTLENLTFVNDKSISLFSFVSKQNYVVGSDTANWEVIQNEWLSLNPENDTNYWVNSSISEESKLELEQDEDSELSLEEFLQTEEK